MTESNRRMADAEKLIDEYNHLVSDNKFTPMKMHLQLDKKNRK